ncbi:MAG: hypothetical protein ABIP97_12940, partial [Chthoniobacterales bacterium]
MDTDSTHQHHPSDPARNDDPKHEQRLDTVAQKPTHIGSGVQKKASAEDAQYDQEHPIPGAQPPLESKKAKQAHVHNVAAGLTAAWKGTTFTF